jgi:hypothetical protein
MSENKVNIAFDDVIIVHGRVGAFFQFQFNVNLDLYPLKCSFRLQSQCLEVEFAAVLPVSQERLAILQHVFDEAFVSIYVVRI